METLDHRALIPPSGVELAGIVRRALAELEHQHGVGPLGQRQTEFRSLQAERIQIRLRIIGNELVDPQVLQPFQRLLHLGAVGAGFPSRQNHAPQLIGGIAMEFEYLPGVGHRQPIERQPPHVRQPDVAPIIGLPRNELQQIGIRHVHLADADHLEEDLVAGAGFEPDMNEVLLVALLKHQGRLGGGEAVLFVHVLHAPQFLSGDEGCRREMFQPAEEVLHAAGLRGIRDRSGQQPQPVCPFRANLQLSLGQHPDARDRRSLQRRQDFRRSGGGAVQVAFDKEDEGEQRDRGRHPEPGVSGVHGAGRAGRRREGMRE